MGGNVFFLSHTLSLVERQTRTRIRGISLSLSLSERGEKEREGTRNVEPMRGEGMAGTRAEPRETVSARV